jgi:glycine cleavage system H lipoate-binding protein
MSVLLAVVFVAIAILVGVLLSRRRGAARPEAEPGPASMEAPHLPGGVFLDPGHAWLQIGRDGRVRVGIDDFLAGALGRPERLDLPRVGDRLERGDPLLKVTAGGRSLVVPSPVQGQVLGINSELLTAPWMLTHDPYALGQVATLWCRDHQAAIAPLRLGSAALAWMRRELQALVDLLGSSSAAPVPLLADGALPRRGALTHLDQRGWELFQARLLGQR